MPILKDNYGSQKLSLNCAYNFLRKIVQYFLHYLFQLKKNKKKNKRVVFVLDWLPTKSRKFSLSS